jgi:hypothetical protein
MCLLGCLLFNNNPDSLFSCIATLLELLSSHGVVGHNRVATGRLAGGTAGYFRESDSES